MSLLRSEKTISQRMRCRPQAVLAARQAERLRGGERSPMGKSGLRQNSPVTDHTAGAD